MTTELSVLLCTHRPDLARLRRTLAALAAQTLSRESWDLLVVDNASPEPVRLPPEVLAGVNARTVVEPQLGLAYARRRGLLESKGDIVVFVDDDNVLSPDYLETALRLMKAAPRVGAAGGRSLPEFEIQPPQFLAEFEGLLALRDLGDAPIVADALIPAGARMPQYPACAPIGAGMVLRREVAEAWRRAPESALPGRRGAALSSGEDNDLVFAVMKAGWSVAYFPELRLTHLIPARRLNSDYLAELNRGVQKSWMQVLTLHGANPWPPITRWTVPLRCAKAWFTYAAWRGGAARIRWRGACGHAEGRAC